MTNKNKKRIDTVGIRLVKEKYAYYDNKIVKSPESASEIFHEYLDGVDREHFVVASLNTKNEVLNLSTVHIGSLNSSVVHPREVLKTVILSNACALVVCHNHPSGNCEPSTPDIEVTKRLQQASEILGIDFLDHIIIGGNGKFSSLKSMGYC